MIKISFSVFNSENFSRIDRFLVSVFKFSRREVKYLFNNNWVLLNGKKIKKSEKIRKRDQIDIFLRNENNFSYSNVKIIKETDDYIIIYKPEGLHSEEHFKNHYSVENFLKKRFRNVKLLNRLDLYSKGFLIAAKNENFYEKYKSLENMREIEKYYLTFVNGQVFEEKVIKNKIDQKKRKKVKVLEEESDINITEILPIAIYKSFSVIIAKIFKGARHQIRAHLSHVEYPLIGDNLYGYSEEEKFFLFCFGYKCEKLGLKFFDYSLLKEDAKRFLLTLT